MKRKFLSASLLGLGAALVLSLCGIIAVDAADNDSAESAVGQDSTADATPPPSVAYYVSLSGDDDNPGTKELPFRTLAKCASKPAPGQTCFVRGGTYTGSGLSAVNSGTSWAAPVRVAGYPGETVIIDSSTTVRLGKEDSYIIFENMIWHRGGQSVEVFQEMPHHIRFKDLEVRYNSSSALRSCHDCEYINLNVHHNGSDGKDHGIYNTGDRGTIIGGRYWNNSSYDIHIYDNPIGGSYPLPSGWVIRDVYVYNDWTQSNGSQGTFFDGSLGIYINGSSHKLFNNIVASTRCSGIQVRAPDSLIANNILYATSKGNLFGGTNCTSFPHAAIIANQYNTIHNNIFLNTGATYHLWIINFDPAGPLPTISHNMTNEATLRVNSQVASVPTNSVVEANILFSNLEGVVPTAWDFHYQAGSSGIDQGVALVEVPDDRDGNDRPCGPASDIGAYEYTGHCVPPSAPVGLRIL